MLSQTSKKFHYLDETDVLVIHAKIIDASGGSHGIRDIQLVRGALDRSKSASFGKELFETVFEKAAAYFDSIAKNHPFVDGNKRTAFALSVRFLSLNGFDFDASNEEVERYVVEVIVKHHDISEIGVWLKKNSKKVANKIK